MIKNFILAVSLVGLISTVVQADDWPQFRGDIHSTAKTTDAIQPPLSLKWTYQAGDKVVSTPTIASGKVFFGSRDNNLYVLNEADGSLAWKYETGKWVDSSATILGSNVFFSSRDGNLYSLKVDDGTLNWKYTTGGADISSPNVVDGVVYGGSGYPNKFAFAVKESDGQELWRFETKQMVQSSPAVLNDTVYIGSNDGKVYGLSKTTGQETWDCGTKGGVNYASPAISNNKLYLAPGSFDWSVYAADLATGTLAWQYEPSEIPMEPTYVSNVAIGNDAVYVVSGYSNQELLSLNTNTGALNWKATLSASTRFGFGSSPAVTDSVVYVSTAKGILKAIDIATGSLIWEYDLGSDVLSSVSIANGTLYIATLAGKLFAFE